MRAAVLIILLVSSVACACNNAATKQDAVKRDTVVLPAADTSALLSQRLQAQDMEKLVAHDDFKQDLFEGKIDSFVIAGRQFRLRYDDKADSVLIEYYDHNSWVKNTAMEIKDQFETSFDWNDDGYKDIFSQSQSSVFINFYIPGKNLFSSQYRLPGDAQYAVDSTNKIYANYSEPYHQCNYYVSQLIDYKNTVPAIHYELIGETYNIDGECIIDSIETIKLYKYIAPKDSFVLIKSFKPATPKEFDYSGFWKNYYKTLPPGL